MESEVRTQIVEFENAVDAAFDLFEFVIDHPAAEEQLRGATVRPIERIERWATDDDKPEVHIAFDVSHDGVPEPRRVLIGTSSNQARLPGGP